MIRQILKVFTIYLVSTDVARCCMKDWARANWFALADKLMLLSMCVCGCIHMCVRSYIFSFATCCCHLLLFTFAIRLYEGVFQFAFGGSGIEIESQAVISAAYKAATVAKHDEWEWEYQKRRTCQLPSYPPSLRTACVPCLDSLCEILKTN